MGHARHASDAARTLAAEVAAHGGTALVVEGDVAREADVSRLLATAIEHFGSVDILINNAGSQKDAAFADMSLADWKATIVVDLAGAFSCSREAVRTFRRQGIRANVSRGRQDHLHQLGASANSVGRSCELRRRQGRGGRC